MSIGTGYFRWDHKITQNVTAECLSDSTQFYRNCSVNSNVRLDNQKSKGTMDQKDQNGLKKDRDGSRRIISPVLYTNLQKLNCKFKCKTRWIKIKRYYESKGSKKIKIDSDGSKKIQIDQKGSL